MKTLVWRDLLNQERVRGLLGGPASVKSEKEERTEFERDYGRTIFSAPFRRLKQKAQVFPLERSDYVRTRLIHSQEVSSVAEDLAFQVARKIEDLDAAAREAIPLVAATCGLIHDLGNPPFGHAGELAIQTWFDHKQEHDSTFLDGLDEQQRQDFLKFEGNAHSLRIVSQLFLLADHYGLNYTCGTISASRKYLPASHRTDGGHSRSKPGYFWSEREVVDIVGRKTGAIDCRHPLAFLVEAADDMVYSVVDIEDGIKRKVLDWNQVQGYLEEECAGDRIFEDAIQLAEQQIKPANFSGPARGEAMAQAFRIAAISKVAISARETFMKRYERIMSGEYDEELLVDQQCEAKRLVKACKKFSAKNLYTHSEILKLEIRGRRVIHDLMDLFWEAVEYQKAGSLPPSTKEYSGKLYNLISDNYRRVFEKRLHDGHEHPKYCKLQLVTDYVAGMTDPFACRLHKELTGE